MKVRSQARQVATAGLLLALLLTLQAFTGFGGQILTGSCVNLVLTVSVYACTFWGTLAIALLSPFCAFLLGVGPQLFPLVPFISLGNVVYVSLLYLIGRRKLYLERIGAVGMAAVAKSVVLWATILRVILPSLGLGEQQLNTLGLMFSWPQILTALIGGCLAALLYPTLQKLRLRAAEE